MRVAPFDYATSRAEGGSENQNVSREDACSSGVRSRRSAEHEQPMKLSGTLEIAWKDERS